MNQFTFQEIGGSIIDKVKAVETAGNGNLPSPTNTTLLPLEWGKHRESNTFHFEPLSTVRTTTSANIAGAFSGSDRFTADTVEKRKIKNPHFNYTQARIASYQKQAILRLLNTNELSEQLLWSIMSIINNDTSYDSLNPVLKDTIVQYTGLHHITRESMMEGLRSRLKELSFKKST